MKRNIFSLARRGLPAVATSVAALLFSALAIGLCTPRLAQAADEGTQPAPTDEQSETAEHPAPSRYWIGVVIRPAEPALRAQLGLAEGEGWVVMRVVPDSPAAKAGIRQHDVVVEVDGKPLESIRELAEAVRHSGGEPLKLKLFRNGESVEAEVAPAPRPAALAERLERPHPRKDEPLAELLERFFPEGPPAELPRDLTFFLPGKPRRIEFPDDLNITITKHGNQPGKIVVEKGDQRWEVTEDSLRELPGEVRRYVQAYLGRLPERAIELGDRGRRAISPYLDRLPPEADRLAEQARRRAHRAAEKAREGVERARDKELERVNHRLERLQKMIEQLQKRLNKADEQQPAETDEG